MTETRVKGIGRICDRMCPICVASRSRNEWLQPFVKFMYHYVCGRPARFLNIPTPCTSRERQTGKKPWE